MFKRQNPRTLAQKIFGFLWPSIGWRRAGAYNIHRLSRIPGSAYSIAAGFACGAAVSFTPFVGLHFILAAILAWIIRANIVASTIGTAVGNPWTFPFIWTWLYKSGRWMTAADGTAAVQKPEFSEVFGNIMEAILNLNLDYLTETAAPVFWPMLFSSLPTGIVVWWVFYLPLKYTVQGYQDRRRRRLEGRAANREPLQ